MDPSVSRLKTLLSPPGEPVGVIADWNQVAEAWGTSFPKDYREFLTAYGAGMIDAYLVIATVVDSEDHGESTVSKLTSVASSLAQEDGEWPYPVWPENGGLICWGATVDSAVLYWDTADPDPDRWPVVVRSREGGFVAHEFGMVDFVTRMLGPAEERPLESPTFYGAPNSRFLNKVEVKKLKRAGVDPWGYLETLYESNEAEDYDGDEDLLVTVRHDGTMEYIPGGETPEH